MFLHRTLYMVIIRQFIEELAIYFQCCISAPYLTYCLVYFFLNYNMDCDRKCRIRTFNLVIDNNILHMTLHILIYYK